MAAKQDLTKFFNKIEKIIKDAVKPAALKPIGQFAVDIIVKRTRLGYGVKQNYGQKEKLKPLSKSYVEQRKKSKLSAFTNPGRSNLTRTGQMLESMRVLTVQYGKVVIGLSGARNDSRYTNAQIAEFNEDRGRVFNKVSKLEFSQILREYRRQFGDLLSKRGLIF